MEEKLNIIGGHDKGNKNFAVFSTATSTPKPDHIRLLSLLKDVDRLMHTRMHHKKEEDKASRLKQEEDKVNQYIIHSFAILIM